MNLESINNQENPYFHDMEATLVGVHIKELQNHPY